MIVNYGFAAAAALSVLGFAIHVFAGGKRIVRPLMASGLPQGAKDLLYLTWHVTTLLVVSFVVVFAYGACGCTGYRPALWYATAMAGACSLLCAVVSLRSDRKSTRLNSSHTDISRMPSSA